MRYDSGVLPTDLPFPEDDGGADHLPGHPLPALPLRATDGDEVRLDEVPRAVVYAFPRMGIPGEDPLVPNWNEIPGARGCTPESCAFRDRHGELLYAGAGAIYGLSTQDTDYQHEARERLHLPFELLSDAGLELTKAMRLPTFEVAGQTLLKRFTLVIDEGRVEHVFYPIFPPDQHAAEVVSWLSRRAG